MRKSLLAVPRCVWLVLFLLFPALPGTAQDVPIPPFPLDLDGDGIFDYTDNCPLVANGPAQGTCVGGDAHGALCLEPEECVYGYCSLDQEDRNADGVGDACEEDLDDDGAPDALDNCPFVANGPLRGTCITGAVGSACEGSSDCRVGKIPGTCSLLQEDGDGDAIGDVCDDCPADALNDADADGICADLDNCAAQYNADQLDTDGDGDGDVCDGDMDGDGIANATDNCPLAFNPPQLDQDGDGAGDLCDTCPAISDQDQADWDLDGLGDLCDSCPHDADPQDTDSDWDGVGDLCDNCVAQANAEQENRDADDLGDACDCDDQHMGSFEEGADCGGVCAGECPSDCIPVVLHGGSAGKIDVLFIPTLEARYDDLQQFRDDVTTAIENSFYADATVAGKRQAINFWYLPERADFDAPGINIPCRRIGTPPWQDRCPQVEFAAILHEDDCRDFSLGGLISAEYDSYATLLHEAGHALFGLADEYDDAPACGTDYFPGSSYHAFPHNIFRREFQCTGSTNNDPNDCFEFTTCLDSEDESIESWNWGETDGWWKAQPAATIMNGRVISAGWGRDGSPSVHHALNGFLPAGASASSLSAEPTAAEGIPSGLIICDLRVGPDDSVELLDTRIGEGIAPNRWLEVGAWRYVLKDRAGADLFQFRDRNPRYIDYDDPRGGGLVDEADFSLVLPLLADLQVLQVGREEFNSASGEHETVILAEFSLVNDIREHCAANPGAPLCTTYDADGDGVPDLGDNCPDHPNRDQGDVDSDGVGDVCDTQQAQQVVVDVKPGSCPNPVNTTSRGVIPAAIVGTQGFDVNTIDPATLRLEGIAPLRWSIEDVAAPFALDPEQAGVAGCSAEGSDGILDLVLFFDTQAVITAIEQRVGRPLQDGETLEAAVVGYLTESSGGAQISGKDLLSLKVVQR